MAAFNYVWIFPLLLIIVPATFFITYIIAVSNGHVASIFPYISDTGALPPESCIFAQFLNLGALFGCITVYVRHRQICEVHSIHGQSEKKWTVIASCALLWIGYVSCFGVSLVANFQEKTLTSVHFTGAMLAFLFGLLYGLGQTVLSYTVDKFITSIAIAHMRLVLVILSTVFFGLIFTHRFIPPTSSTSDEKPSWTFVSHKVNSTSKGYDLYLVSAFSEWSFAITSILFFVTFAAEFRKIVLHPPLILLAGGQNDRRPSGSGQQWRKISSDIPGRKYDYEFLENVRIPRVKCFHHQYNTSDSHKYWYHRYCKGGVRYYKSFEPPYQQENGNSTTFDEMETVGKPTSNYKLGSKTWNPQYLRRIEERSQINDCFSE